MIIRLISVLNWTCTERANWSWAWKKLMYLVPVQFSLFQCSPVSCLLFLTPEGNHTYNISNFQKKIGKLIILIFEQYLEGNITRYCTSSSRIILPFLFLNQAGAYQSLGWDIGTSVPCSSRSGFGQSTGNAQSSHYKHNYVPFFSFSVATFFHRRRAWIKKLISRKLTGVPKTWG